MFEIHMGRKALDLMVNFLFLFGFELFDTFAYRRWDSSTC